MSEDFVDTHPNMISKEAIESARWQSSFEVSTNSELLSLLDVETILTRSLGTHERCHRKMLALSFVEMAIAVLDQEDCYPAAVFPEA
jgi:hypothetical protein